MTYLEWGIIAIYGISCVAKPGAEAGKWRIGAWQNSRIYERGYFRLYERFRLHTFWMDGQAEDRFPGPAC